MKLPNSGVCVRASTQLNSSERASTTNSGLTISATDEGARYSGRNENMAISVAPSRLHRGALAPSTTAVRRAAPRSMACCALSVTTMALSTSMPIAMMKPASEVRFSPSPRNCIRSSVPPIEKSSELPISTPARKPMTSMMIRMTIATDSARLRMNVELASRAMRFSG